MAEINLTDNKGRDAVVAANSVAITKRYNYIDSKGAAVVSKTILRSRVGYDIETIMDSCGGDLGNAGQALIDGDPDVDIETFGEFLEETSRVYVNDDRQIVYKITQWENIHTPDGKVKDRRPKEDVEQNVSTETPLKWTGKMMKKSEVYNKFMFSGKMQISHVNGLTYDFLYSMAKELSDADSLLLLGAGTKGNQPLIFRRGALAYRGFLEGRIDGKRYALILHLSNMELKAPAKDETEEN